MLVADLARQVRQVLQDSPDPQLLNKIVESIQLAISGWSDSESQHLLNSLEDIYHDVIDHDLFHQVDTLLTVLYHLRSIIPATSLISTWFDLVLRPALREPKLPTSGVKYAKELILAALETQDHENVEMLRNFRRRLFDLYLLDAYNESSSDDALEWAELDQDQRDRKARWKANLQDVLIMFGLKCPKDLMSEIFHCFAAPSSRLQLLILLNSYSSQPAFPELSPTLATHPLFNSLILSLQVDGSSTECTVGLSFFTKILVIFAVHAPEALKSNLPQFLIILARVISWKARLPTSALASPDPESHPNDRLDPLEISPDVDWERLELTFGAAASAAPSVDRYFTHLYYLFPCNVVEFVRNPAEYLDAAGSPCPYVAGWDRVFDEDQILRKSQALFQGHVIHAAFLATKDAVTELEDPPFWADYDLPRIIGESTMMDVRNVAAGLCQIVPLGPAVQPAIDPASKSLTQSIGSDSSRLAETVHRTGRYRVSVQDIIATSVALKSGLDIDVDGEGAAATWPNVLFSSSYISSPGRRSVNLPPDAGSIRSYNMDREAELPLHVAEAVSGLQRQLLLLSNELNLELWLSRKNVQHITRLNQQRVTKLNEEGEWQALHNKLKGFEADAARYQKELKDHKEQASSVKNKYADWNAELQQKLREFREQKRTWTLEIAQLRSADLQHKATFEAQGKLLASATSKVFELETTIKETAHKVDRLHDYEKQIDQLIRMQQLWGDDTKKLNEQTEQIRAMDSEYQSLRVMLKSYQEGRVDLEAETLNARKKAESLEAQLALTQQQLESASNKKVTALAKTTEAASSNLLKTNQRLRDENGDLRDQIDELKAMVEILKARGTPGLVPDPSTSPRAALFA